MIDKYTAPVLLLIFNRVQTTAKVFEAIAKAKPRRLFVAADGPRRDRPGEFEKCCEVRKIVDQVDWPCEVKTLFRDSNLGCKKAVNSAIDWFFSHEEEGIILEDDCLPSDSFFTYCSSLLERYRDDDRVMMISGDNFQDGIQRGKGSYYFSRIFHIWGWATWRRAWRLNSAKEYLDLASVQLKLGKVFSDNNLALSWLHAMCQVEAGTVNTWDYPWAYSCLINQGLSVVPNTNLITNIGFGEKATHTTDVDSNLAYLKRAEIDDIEHPEFVYCNDDADLYEYRSLYPHKKGMNIIYKFRRYRKARRLRIKIGRLMKQIRYNN